MLYGRTNATLPSRFLREIPEDLTVKKGNTYTPQRSYVIPEPKRSTAYQNPYTYAAPAQTAFLELNKGDMITHTAFGKGMVLSVMKMGGDALLEIAFDQIGTKRLMAKAATPHMKKL